MKKTPSAMCGRGVFLFIKLSFSRLKKWKRWEVCWK